MVSFRSKLEARVAKVDSLLCVGLDPHERELRSENKGDAAFTFCKNLIEATSAVACCYKPNAAFFEALGDDGMKTLRRVIAIIPEDIPILLDVKRGDIDSTAIAYAKACYTHLGADAVTLSPLMGWDSVSPFVTDAYSDRGAFLLCKTSNPGSNDLLNFDIGNERLFERIADLVGQTWAVKTPDALLGLVVGATDPEALSKARRRAGDDVWILAPGVGAQGGNLKDSLQAGLNCTGGNMLIPISRGISQAPDPAKAAQEFCEKIRAVQQQLLETKVDDKAAILPHQQEFLEFSLRQGVLKFGSFVLKSGRTSPYFFNAGLFSTGSALFSLGHAYAKTIMNSQLSDGSGSVNFDVIFGPAYKGISLGAVVSCALYREYEVDVGFAYNRKEAKDHGEGGQVVGASLTGNRVLIIDDVITAGTAIRQAFTLLNEVSAKPVGVVIALDRDEVRALDDKLSAVQAVARDLAIQVVSIVSLKELQSFLEQSPDYDDATLQSVVQYRSEYGAS